MASHDEMIQAVRVRRNFQSNYGREFDHESWIYFAYGMTGEVIETGELIDSGYELDRAIAEAVCALGLDLTPDQFARQPQVDGGYAVWTMPESCVR